MGIPLQYCPVKALALLYSRMYISFIQEAQRKAKAEKLAATGKGSPGGGDALNKSGGQKSVGGGAKAHGHGGQGTGGGEDHSHQHKPHHHSVSGHHHGRGSHSEGGKGSKSKTQQVTVTCS